MGELLDRAMTLKSTVAISSVIGESVELRKCGSEFEALCPIHKEKSPSFTVNDAKGIFHCFGCGASGDVFDWLRQVKGMALGPAVEYLGGERSDTQRFTPRATEEHDERTEWTPIMPVPGDAPRLMAGVRTIPLQNPKRSKLCTLRPVLVHPYRTLDGLLLGYVLRCQFDDGKKFTPQVTYCRHEDGRQAWCIQNFPRPRPLYGLHYLRGRPDALAVLVEGEKTADAARRLLPQCVVVTWAGGCKGIAHVDWSPLAGRDVVTIEDSDDQGAAAMLGWDRNGRERVPGIIERLTGLATRVRRCVPHGVGRDGWDLADADWTPSQVLAWVRRGLVSG